MAPLIHNHRRVTRKLQVYWGGKVLQLSKGTVTVGELVYVRDLKDRTVVHTARGETLHAEVVPKDDPRYPDCGLEYAGEVELPVDLIDG